MRAVLSPLGKHVYLYLTNDSDSDCEDRSERPAGFMHKITLRPHQAANHLGLQIDTSDFHEMSRYHHNANPFE